MDKNCYACGLPGHFAASCPLAVRAATWEEHLARIAESVQRWVDGEISIEDKQRMIAAENILWHGEHKARMRGIA